MASLRQSEIQGKDKKQINTYICKYLCNVEMGNSNTGATEEEVEEIENEEKEPGTIIQEIQKGFTMKDRLLRPSLVGVSKKTEKKEEENHENRENSENK